MMKVNGTHVHAVIQVCCIGLILLLLISITYIIHLKNFSKVQNLPSYLRNVEYDDMQSKDLCMWTGGRLNGFCLGQGCQV